MPIDSSLVGLSGTPAWTSWTSKDALLYALGVGAGQPDPLDELEFTTENSEATPQVVLPTFANVAFVGGGPSLPDDVDFTKVLHASQALSLTGPLPTDGRVETTGTITGVYDKGSGALVMTETVARDSVGQIVGTLESGLFLRGYGGFGGERGPSDSWELPTGKPDRVVTYTTRPDQALLYRLSGDRNPLHSDPAFSARGGFPTPILHGMCTYGYAGRALLHTIADSDPKRFRGMSGRFSKSVLPGQTITTSIWVDGTDVRFRTVDESGDAVIDKGTATIH
ncbi:MaoC family dehydratase N-terminal domain-containing protein [Rhodococcus erythropolis]|jgi:acyl dehydratase|uniref:Enoyl-CoA hydratase n=2 Tax=Nocardiaceae TaxID=85025 RepID=A0A0E3VB32_RHOER|nr:enoyl-CoA hydratase [Rhodococcus erythropolis]KAB2581433.1 enoyl-CoA hydratase [Rhodococcus erythropolis]MBO8150045.1 MaoC family dehydratase N-terminal domain-containing protein [Rhodococcus erythropolis]MBT1257698.1 MaoC family dehydratase N-terminal domain-containing protein [Rhodococcus erythropolis]MDO1492259.1 enoyl-CoA hydratase [Rhodococcus erythropolis]